MLKSHMALLLACNIGYNLNLGLLTWRHRARWALTVCWSKPVPFSGIGWDTINTRIHLLEYGLGQIRVYGPVSCLTVGEVSEAVEGIDGLFSPNYAIFRCEVNN